ncbi:proteasome activator pa28 REG alpha/beta subunit [Mycena maculata]|uniref:Proteasome activator pa28 REG alpha/beta subunit n=1 Tax=Mycena maculata TaxID=230809 RepID=A0AAD7N9D9_9AGAR|nr:proteasome activator pa28 REG alpha/beta subunit [Mycena maculata]
MEKNLAQRLQAFQKQASVSGEHVVFVIFPTKILELQELIQSTSVSSSPYHRDQTATTTDTMVYSPPELTQRNGDQPQLKKRKTDDGSPVPADLTSTNDMQYARLPSLVLANKHMINLHSTLKRECEELVALTDQVKLWISLTMPKIEGGDNFGVQIQEEVVAELLRSQESAFNLRDTARNDYLARAKICSKLIKYPNVQDYTFALKEHDENQFFLARQHLIDLRNIYAVLTDLIHKNIAKIRTPKGENSVALY